MKLVEEFDAILRQKCNPFDFEEPIMDPYELSDGLQKIRKEGAGVGLAAPQVGLYTQVLVIGMGDFQTEGAEDYDQVFFNPTITSTDGKSVYMMEGCLSFPGLFLKIKRPENITLEWYTEEDTVCSERFTGMTSRILQHEVDHLNGLTFTRLAERYHLLKGQKDRKLQKRYRKRHKTDIIIT